MTTPITAVTIFDAANVAEASALLGQGYSVTEVDEALLEASLDGSEVKSVEELLAHPDRERLFARARFKLGSVSLFSDGDWAAQVLKTLSPAMPLPERSPPQASIGLETIEALPGDGSQCTERGYSIKAAGGEDSQAATVSQTLITGAALAALAETGFAKIRDQMLPVPGGTFEMGDNDSEFADEKPAHEVTVSSFRMSKNAVTNAEYRAWVKSLRENRFFLVGTDPKTGWPKIMAMGTKEAVEQYRDEMNVKDIEGTLQVWEALPYEPYKDFDRPKQPANVNWYSAHLFAFMHGTRLTTEAEWEFAASEGGKIREYDSEIIHTSHLKGKTATVDVDDPRYPDGVYGLRHIIGNVLKWTMDWHGDYPAVAQTDPTGPVSGGFRVLRGASWFDDSPAYRRVSNRGFNGRPDDRYNFVGFRLVRQDSQR